MGRGQCADLLNLLTADIAVGAVLAHARQAHQHRLGHARIQLTFFQVGPHVGRQAVVERRLDDAAVHVEHVLALARHVLMNVQRHGDIANHAALGEMFGAEEWLRRVGRAQDNPCALEGVEIVGDRDESVRAKALIHQTGDVQTEVGFLSM